MSYGPPIAEKCPDASHGWCDRVNIEQERLIGGDVIHEGWWHLQSVGPNVWRMWGHETRWLTDRLEFSIETPSQDKHELDIYIGEAARQTLYSDGLLDPGTA
jgi:hypothetical protein